MTTLDTRPRPPPWPAFVVLLLVVLVDVARCAVVDTREPAADNLGPMRIPLVALLSLVALLAACREPEPAPEPADVGDPCEAGYADAEKTCKDGLTCNTGNGYLDVRGHCAASCDDDDGCEDGQFCNGEGACTWTCSDVKTCPAGTGVDLACVPAEGGGSMCVGWN